jgi:hypothetical protein
MKRIEMARNEQQSANASEQVSMESIHKDFLNNKDPVIEMLIKNVINVNVDIPRVVKGDFDEDDLYQSAV